MTLHLIKLAVGCETVEDIRRFQVARKKQLGRIVHWTTMYPKRAEEIVKGGSLYWVVKGILQARQRIVGIERAKGGHKPVAIVLAPKLFRIEPRRCRPFQGWRYFASKDAPADLAEGSKAIAKMPPEMLRSLRDLGLI